MSKESAIDLYAAVQNRDQAAFNFIMDQEFADTTVEDFSDVFRNIHDQIPKHYIMSFQAQLLQWMSQDHVTQEICQTCVTTFGFTTLLIFDLPEVYKKIGVVYLLENQQIDSMFNQPGTANSLINSTISFHQPKCFSYLSEQPEISRLLEFSNNSDIEKFFNAVTSLEHYNSMYYTAFWKNLSSVKNWEHAYLRSAIINNNLTAILDFLHNKECTDDMFKEVLLNGHRDYQVLHTMLTHFPKSWQTMALTYLLSVHLVSEKNFDLIAHLNSHEQIQIFDGVVEYWTQDREYRHLLNNLEHFRTIFNTIVSQMPRELNEWAVGEKNPLWTEMLFPIVPAFERYILQTHIKGEGVNMKKSKI